MILGAAAGRGPSPLRLLAACLALGCAGARAPPPAAGAPRPRRSGGLRSPPRAPLAARASGRVALVEVDERSLAEAGRWPWPRDRVAALLDRVRGLGAAAIGLDILFAEPDAGGDGAAGGPAGAGGGPRSRPGTRRSRRRSGAGPVVIGYAFTFDRPVDRPCQLRSIGLGRAAAGGALAQVPRAAGVLCSLGPARGGGGRVRLHERVGRRGRHPPAHAADRRVRRRDLPEPGARHRPGGPRRASGSGSPTPPRGGRPSGSAIARSRSTPTGACSCASADPAGAFPRFSAIDVLRGRVPAGALAGRIVFVGVSALGLGDMVATPLGTFLPGAEVHATVADNLLQGDFVRRPRGRDRRRARARVRRRGRGGPRASSRSGGGGPCRWRSAAGSCCGSARAGCSARAAGTSRPCSRGSRSPAPWASPRSTGWSPSARAPTRATASSGPRAR